MPNPSRQPWLRLLVLLMVVAALGLPINHMAAYGLLVLAALIVFTAPISVAPARWLGAAAAVLVAAGAHLAIDPPRIEEGHNIFLADGDRAPLAAALPPDVHSFMAAELARVYPPERRCDPTRYGCWRGQEFPDRAYAFAADGLWDRPEMTRRVDGIDFRNPVDLRLSATNDGRYNWYPVTSDILRLERDGRAWKGIERWQLMMPFYLAYKFPQAFAGSDLCWTGSVLWEGTDGRFSLWQHPAPACRTLERADVGRRIFGVAIEPGSLSMRLDPPVSVRLWQGLDATVRLAAVVAIVALLLAGGPPRRVLLPALLIGLVVIAAIVDDAAFLGGFRPHDGGDDGLKYEGFAAEIIHHLLAGNIGQALMGAEPVFYYGGPGFRYLRAIERFLFGDTNLGYLSLVLILPVAVYALFRRFLGTSWALVLVLAFVATPIGAVFGSSFFQYLKFAARGYADPGAYIFFVCGFVVLARAPDVRDRFWPAWSGALLLALGVFLRPNIAPVTGIAMAGAALMALAPLQPRRLIGLCLGFALVLFMPLHNWIWGKALVLFSSNSADSNLLVMPPSAWLAALGELMRLDLGGAHVARVVQQLGGWLSGVSESALTIPLHVAGLVVLVHVALRGRAYDPWLRLLAVATVAQQCVGLFYVGTPRYYLLTWLLTFVVVAAWTQREGFPWLAQRAPWLFDNGAVKRIEAKVGSLQRRLGLAS